MAALQGDKTLAELSSQYVVHVNQIQTWRSLLEDNMVSLFDSGMINVKIMKNRLSHCRPRLAN